MRTTETKEERIKRLTKAFESLKREESCSTEQVNFVAEVVLWEIYKTLYPEGEEE